MTWTNKQQPSNYFSSWLWVLHCVYQITTKLPSILHAKNMRFASISIILQTFHFHAIFIFILLSGDLFNRYWRRRLGMQVDYVENEGYRFCFSHRGSPGARPSILMLHGFSAHKDMWLGVVKARNRSGLTVHNSNMQFGGVLKGKNSYKMLKIN